MHLYVHFQVIQVVTGCILKTSPWVSSATKIHRAGVLRASFPTWPDEGPGRKRKSDTNSCYHAGMYNSKHHPNPEGCSLKDVGLEGAQQPLHQTSGARRSGAGTSPEDACERITWLEAKGTQR